MRERLASFESAALDGEKYEVRSFEGKDELNGLFSFDLLVVRKGVVWSPDDVAPLLMERAILRFEEDGEVVQEVFGLVSEASIEVDAEDAMTHLRVRLVPRVALLSQHKGDEIFLGRTIPEVIAEKLAALGLSRDHDFMFSLLERYPAREFIAQHDETDYAFVARLCEHVGIVTLFEHRDGRDVFVLSDTETSYRPIRDKTLAVKRRREHPAAYDVRTTLRRVPAEVDAHDYNYRSPKTTLREARPVASPGALGKWVDFGSHPKTPDETRALARLRSQELFAQNHIVEGKTTTVSVRAGGTFSLLGAGPDQELLLTQVTYHFRAGDDEKASAWENRFIAIPATTRFVPARKTPWPRISGLLNAVVDGSIKGDYAELDDQGRYHLRMAYDRSGRTDKGATHPVRMMQPHAGSHYGMHFPLRPGTEVLVGFVNGDPDRPVIVGTAPNPLTASPVDFHNQTQNVLRSGSNNEIVMEDERGIERIRIHSPHETTTIQLGSVEEAEEGALTTTTANISQASRVSNNEATARKTLMADSSTAALGRSAIVAVGIGAVSAAAQRGLERPDSVSLADLTRDLATLAAPPKDGDLEGEDAAPVAEEGDGSAGGLWSAVGEALRGLVEAAAIELVRVAGRRTDESLDRSMGLVQGEPIGDPLEPAAIMASQRTAALVGREVAMVFGDRVAALSSHDTASVVGTKVTLLKSPGSVEVAGAEEVRITSAGELGMEARLVRIVGGYYPDAEAPPLDEGTTVGVMSRRDLRFLSVEDCILLCAQKNLIGTAHAGDVRLRAKKTVSLTGGSIVGSAGTISFKSSGNTAIEADGDVSVKASGNVTVEAGGDVVVKGATVTIEGGTITLSGPTTIDGDLTVTGSSNV